MLKKLLGPLISGQIYNNTPPRLQKKLQILINTTVFMSITAVILTAVMIITKAYLVSVVCALVVILCLATFILIRKGQYKLASNIFLLFLYCAFFTAIKFDLYIDQYETYVFSTLGLVLLFVASLIGYANYQLYIITLLSIITILVLFFIDILPQAGWKISILHIQNLSTSIIMIIIGSVLAIKHIKLQDNLLNAIRKEKNEIDKMLKITEIYTKKSLISIISEGGDPTRFLPEEKNIAVLFTDIVGFTSLAERMKAIDTVRFLNSYFNRMNYYIQENNGEIDKLIGDGIMASFADCSNAVKTAVLMRTALQRYNRERIDYGLYPIDTGSGIVSGEVVIGNIGSENKMDYTVIGDVVNASARIESLTRFYGVDIIISDDVYEKSCEKCRSRLLDTVMVKGKTHPIKIYELFEHEPEDIKEMKEKMTREFSEVQMLYSEGKLRKVCRLCNELIKKAGNHSFKQGKCADPVLNFYYDRSHKMIQALDSGYLSRADWNGIYIFDKKK